MACADPISIKNPSPEKNPLSSSAQRLTVPCGRCGACLKRKRNMWTFRLKQEAKQSSSSYFLTLTYNEGAVPTDSNGELTLHKRDLQNYIKKIRQKQDSVSTEKIRYYAVGEYGTKTDRPHYHMLLFNADYRIIDFASRTWSRWEYSPQLGKNVEQPLADWVDIKPCLPERIHYICKYHVNTHNHQIRDDEYDDRQPEFANMSQGIGQQYLTDEMIQWHRNTKAFYIRDNGFKKALPRYYKDKIFTDYEKAGYARYCELKTHQDFEKEIDRLMKLKVRTHQDITITKNMTEYEIDEMHALHYYHESRKKQAKKYKAKVSETEQL